jgi:protein-export membrane protein SecD/preprotein translocase SecF subunit
MCADHSAVPPYCAPSPSVRSTPSSLRGRLLIILGVTALFLWSIYPPQERIKRGLDLNGGVHLVLRVQTDDALRAATAAAADRLREALREHDVRFNTVEPIGATEFAVSGVHDDAAFRSISAETELTFNRGSESGGAVFRMRPEAETELRDDTVEQALEIIERRVNELGVAEPVVARYTRQDQILVQLPGVSGVDRAKQIIRSTAQLRLTLVEQGPFVSRDQALRAYNHSLPRDLEILPGQSSGTNDRERGFYVVRRIAALTGNDLRNARPSLDEFNRPAVAFALKENATRPFAAFTEAHIDRTMATVLDDRVVAVATIISRIDREGQIVGVSREQMAEQVINLRSGALPADLEYVEERMIGASLGKASIRAGIVASIGGLVLVALFMIAYYRRTGLNALASVALNLLILLGLVAYLPVTMTLPGIAGLILTIGMGVDSNVLIFERIKEELAAGRTDRGAVIAGFDRVWMTIVDTHVASLIAAAFLYQFGTSPIRGFATTLTIGLLANVFTAVFVSKTLLLRRTRSAAGPLSIRWGAGRRLTGVIDFGRWRRHAIAFSVLVVVAGAAAIATRGLPLGIDFSGGTLVVVEFSQSGVSEDAVRDAVQPMPGEAVVQQYGAAEERRFLVKVPLAPGATPDVSLDTQAGQVARALEAANLAPFAVVNRELVSAMIGGDLQRRAISATLASIVAITIFIGVRFRFSFAAGGIVATLHDIVVTVACLALAGYELSLNVTAALLTITGYSVNDTIVVFDRVRENLAARRREPLEGIVNLSVTQTLSRTIITAGTTFLAALALFLFGGEALEGFAFTMLVGIACGTYSTVFIASAIAIVLNKRVGRGESF